MKGGGGEGLEHIGLLAESWTWDRPVPCSWLTGSTVFLHFTLLLSTSLTNANVQTWLIICLQESKASTQTNKIKAKFAKSM